MERPQVEPVAERPLHATEDSHNRGSEEGSAPSKRIQLPLTKHRLLINNWIRDSPITGVRTDLQSHLGNVQGWVVPSGGHASASAWTKCRTYLAATLDRR